jgi:hypothetical protein
VELLYSKGFHAGVACYRKWEPVPVEAKLEPPELIAVANARTYGVNFSSRKEEYVSCWFRTPVETVARGQLRFEISGLGIPALHVKREPDGVWVANFRLPPGLKSGWNEARLRFPDSKFGRALRVAVDMPLNVHRLVVTGVRDGITWSDAAIRVRGRGSVSCWVKGLPENADRGNVGIRLGDIKLGIEYVGEPDAEGCRQINAAVPGDIARGEHAFTIECGGVRSEPSLLMLS